MDIHVANERHSASNGLSPVLYVQARRRSLTFNTNPSIMLYYYCVDNESD